MQRLLTPQRPMHPGPVSIHEVLERVRSLLVAEFPQSLKVRRDYDTSLPDLIGDREQLIQAILNIGRNAAQAMAGVGSITLRTRAARQVTLARNATAWHWNCRSSTTVRAFRRISASAFSPAGLGARRRLRSRLDHCAEFRAASPRHHRMRKSSGAHGVHHPAAARDHVTPGMKLAMSSP